MYFYFIGIQCFYMFIFIILFLFLHRCIDTFTKVQDLNTSLTLVFCWCWLYFLIVWSLTNLTAVCVIITMMQNQLFLPLTLLKTKDKLTLHIWWRWQNTEMTTKRTYYTKYGNISRFVCYMSYVLTNIRPSCHSQTKNRSLSYIRMLLMLPLRNSNRLIWDFGG